MLQDWTNFKFYSRLGGIAQLTHTHKTKQKSSSIYLKKKMTLWGYPLFIFYLFINLCVNILLGVGDCSLYPP
jgi:hypothetical protein